MPDQNVTKFDADLSERDIQALSSADAVTAFFAGLGYDTNARTVQTPGNLGIGTEGTLRPIKRIELLADREGLFQVYLFELISVTVGHTRALARAFRNRAGSFLLVLTSDYEQLDFVLLERFLPPAPPGGTIGERQVGIRPRTLTVERRNPGRRALRVLKRLTWTEADGFAQHDKLLAAYAVADWAEEHFNNRALFSDYYLLERLREFAEWREDPKPAYTVLRKLYLGAAADHAGKSIGDLKKGLIEPALAALGFDARDAKPTTSHETSDYRLFAPGGKEPLALLLAYPWARFLDGKDDQRDSETLNENPGAIVVSLLEKNEAPWVIVTNGRLWRLYARQTHSRATNYYELDAEELLSDTGAPVTDVGEAFRYFWLLFRRRAFEKRPAQREGKAVELSLLDRLLLESEDYARQLGSRLKDRVFEDVFPHLAHGFVEHLRAKSGTRAVEQDQLDEIYQGTLTLLYRLLFLLYAEARDLFPVREVRGYWETSLTRLKREVADCAGEIDDEVEAKLKKAYRDDQYTLWERLERLFAVVDRGEAALNVPFYNGGLFLTQPEKDDDSPEGVAARFLAIHRVADRDLARAVDLLSRTVDDKRHSLVSIDYKSLGVRQLGSIYEGLLEFKVRIATEKLAITKEKGREIYAPFAELDDKAQARAERAGRMVKKGAVYLENDKRERKASGSYYTPDYIVEYIVEHAVGPVLAEKFETMRAKLRAAQSERNAFFNKQKALEARGISPDHPAKAERIGRELVDELFDIKVLDPAMGSGHFLVEAVDFITDRMLTFLNAFPWNPVQTHLTETRDAILIEVEQQGVTLDPAKLTDVNLLKRHVLKRCIYGVDLNPMAVELAKVSLWLDCFTLGAPLSFLDHHLRCGNSLIGITEQQFEETQKGQLDLLSGSQYAGAKMAVGAMIEVGLLPDITPEQTRESRRHYSIAVEALAPVKHLFDVYASQWFGNTPEKAGRGKQRFERNPALDFLRDPLCEEWSHDPQKAKLPEHFEQIAGTALETSMKYRFFHWELEFPEVFFGTRPGTTQVIERLEGAGFDAVIGNPPYGGNLALQEKSYFSSSFISGSGLQDLYTLFLERGTQLARVDGRYGVIIPNSLLTIDQGESIRKLLLHRTSIVSIINLVESVFAEAVISVMILLWHLRIPRSEHQIAVYNPSTGNFSPQDFIHGSRDWHDVSQSRFLSLEGNQFNIRVHSDEWALIEKILSLPKRLSDYIEARQGVKTGNKERFLFQNWNIKGIANSKRQLLRDAVSGANLEPYNFYSDETLLYDVPAMEKEPSSSPRQVYAHLFSMPKLFLQHIRNQTLSRRLVVASDDDSHFPLESVYILTLRSEKGPSLYLLLALLNSRLLDFIYARFNTSIFITGSSVGRLPLPDLDKTGISNPFISRSLKKISGNLKFFDHAKLLLDQILAAPIFPAADACELMEQLAREITFLHRRRKAAIFNLAVALSQILGKKLTEEKRKCLAAYLAAGSIRNVQSDTSELKIRKDLVNLLTRYGHREYNDIEFNQATRSIWAATEPIGKLRETASAAEQLIDQLTYALYGLDDAAIAFVETQHFRP